MYEEPTEGLEKMVDKAVEVLINHAKHIHPFGIERLLKELHADYHGWDLSTKYHKQYYPFLLAFINGVNAANRKKLTDEKRNNRIREHAQKKKQMKKSSS